MREANALLVRKRIELSFPYDLEIINIIRSIEGRKWVPEYRVWQVPATPWHAQQVILKLTGEFFIDPAIKRLAEQKSLPPKLQIPAGLYPFQQEGVKFIVRAGGRCIIGDEMGLGKTIEALSYIQMFGGKTLIVCPANVVFKWKDECQKWVPNRSVAVVSNGGIALPDVDIMIMSYSIATMQYTKLTNIPFDAGIWDEAHYLKNQKTQRTRVAKALITSGLPKVLFLSGTPFMNRPSELFTLLNLLDPIGFSNYWSYAVKYCGAQRVDGMWIFPRNGISNADELASRLTKYMIRRTKKDVELQLPDLSRSYLPITIGNRSEYNAARKKALLEYKKGKSKANALTTLAELRQVVGKAKVEAAIDLAKTILDMDRKVVLFAHHRSVVASLESNLREYGTLVIDGSTDQETRQENSKLFLRPDSSSRVMIMSVAGAEGIDLYSASDIIFVEREWTPAKEEQAEARLHRIGQKNPVTAYYIVALDTVDEKMNDLIKEKRKIFGAVIRQDDVLETILEALSDE